MQEITQITDTVTETVTDEIENASPVGKIGVLAAIIVISLILITVIDKLIKNKIIESQRQMKNETKIKTIVSIFNSFVKVFILGFALIFILDYMGVNTRSLLAVAGIGGVAIAFAAQSIVKDVITGAFILLENQYNIGDNVEIGSKAGTIVEMGLRVVKIKDVSGAIHIIPNGSITQVTNNSKSNMRVAVDIHLPFNVTFDEATKVIENKLVEIKRNSDLFLDHPEIQGISGLDSVGYKITIQANSRAGNQWAAQRLIRKEILETLQEKDMLNFYLFSGEYYGKI